MTPSTACTTVMAIPRNAIAERERTPVAISTVSNKATLREAAYRAKRSSLPGPSRPAREKPALTPVLRSVTSAQLQNRFVIVLRIRARALAEALIPALQAGELLRNLPTEFSCARDQRIEVTIAYHRTS